jgi:hypothetical protein
MIPIAQTSIGGAATLPLVEIISGVMYLSVAEVFFSADKLVMRPAIPKSTTLILVLAES